MAMVTDTFYKIKPSQICLSVLGGSVSRGTIKLACARRSPRINTWSLHVWVEPIQNGIKLFIDYQYLKSSFM